MTDQPTDLIKRADGSYVRLTDLPIRQQLDHELAEKLFPMAIKAQSELFALKKLGLAEMRAHREMMWTDHGLKIDGREGGFSIKTVDGTKRVELRVSKTISLGPEIDVAKELLDQFMAQELRKGASDAVQMIVSKVFKINKKGRLDTAGILGLRDHKIDDPLWLRAIEAIDEAICNDAAATYLRFYDVDVEKKRDALLDLSLAGV